MNNRVMTLKEAFAINKSNVGFGLTTALGLMVVGFFSVIEFSSIGYPLDMIFGILGNALMLGFSGTWYVSNFLYNSGWSWGLLFLSIFFQFVYGYVVYCFLNYINNRKTLRT